MQLTDRCCHLAQHKLRHWNFPDTAVPGVTLITKNPADVTTTSPKRTVRSDLSDNSVIYSRSPAACLSEFGTVFTYGLICCFSSKRLRLCTLIRLSVSWMMRQRSHVTAQWSIGSCAFILSVLDTSLVLHEDHQDLLTKTLCCKYKSYQIDCIISI